MSFENSIDPAWEAVPQRIAATQVATPPPLWGMQRDGTIQMRIINARRYPLRTGPRPPTDQPTYCQVVITITFQDDNPTFSLTASSMGGDGPSTLASAGADQATPELTKTETDTPKSATPTALEVNHFSLNTTLTTGLYFQ